MWCRIKYCQGQGRVGGRVEGRGEGGGEGRGEEGREEGLGDERNEKSQC